MDGLLILDKPAGITSAKALYRVRSILKQRKSGHAGTLDPAATGVLILCLGKATKLVERLMGLPKEYVATARLDVTSSSFDSDRETVPVQVPRVPTDEEVRAACAAQVGTIFQTPPAVSAIKIGGRAAYKLERAGKPPTLSPRPVRIDRLTVTRYAWPELDFELVCGRGTYVRAIIRDLGTALGTGGCLTSLRRTQIGPFHVETAFTISCLGTMGDPWEAVISLEDAGRMLATAKSEYEQDYGQERE